MRYVHLPAGAVDTALLEDATRRGECELWEREIGGGADWSRGGGCGEWGTEAVEGWVVKWWGGNVGGVMLNAGNIIRIQMSTLWIALAGCSLQEPSLSY